MLHKLRTFHIFIPSAEPLHIFKKGSLTLITCPHTTSKQKHSLLFGLGFVCLARAKRVITMGRKRSSPMNVLSEWVKMQFMRVKICLGAMVALLALVALKLTIHDLNHFYIGSEFIHALGITVLIYKLTTKKTCSGTCIYIYIPSQHVFLLSIFKITRSCCC